MQVFASRPGPLTALGIAFGLLVIAGIIQWSLYAYGGSRIPFTFFLPAVGIAAMWLGWLPALVVLMGGLLNSIVWVGPTGHLVIPPPGDPVELGGYLVAGGILLLMGEHMRRLRTDAVDAQDALAARVRDLGTLHEVASRALRMSDADEQFPLVLRALCRLLDTDRAQVYRYDEATGTLRSAADVGLSDEARRTTRAIDVGVSAAGLAFKEKRTIVVEDVDRDERVVPAWREIARRLEARSMHSRPLINMHGEVFGALSLYFREPRVPSERDTYIAELFTHMTSVLAERQTLAERSMALSRRVEVALETSAVPFAILDPVRDEQGRIVDSRWEYVNRAAAELVGKRPSEMIGRRTRDTLDRDWYERSVVEQFRRAHEAGGVLEFDLRLLIKGHWRWFHAITSPLDDSLAIWFADISERKHHEQVLRNADRRKDEFLATLAHELRNPLAPIRQATMIARSPSARPEQKQWSLEVIDRQISHMALLLDDLLDVSRITRGKLELRPRITDLREVLDAALEAARPAIEARGQHLSVEWPNAAVWAKVDAMRMSQVVSNLLTNACKYTASGGQIWLTGWIDEGEAVVEVRDDGIGIRPDDLERVFEMFTQVRPQSGTSTGLGIGLALARGIAHMHGASLTAASEGAGRGSTFTLRIPLSTAPAERPGRRAAPEAGRRRRRILVADDNRDAAESLAEVLRMAGHEVRVTYDGPTAKRVFGEMQPEVALLDIGMPGMTGNEVASAIRALPEGASALLVAITGWGQDRDRAAAREAGFDYHFTKPVNPEELLRLIDNPVSIQASAS